jgi:hypothetical protein
MPCQGRASERVGSGAWIEVIGGRFHPRKVVRATEMKSSISSRGDARNGLRCVLP